MANPDTTPTEEEILFETICQSAKSKDEKALAKMIAEGHRFNVFHGEYNLVMVLATKGETEAVELLISKFGASLGDAVQGYAYGGHEDRVENLIARGASLNDAVEGYAQRGCVDEVKNLIARGASLHDTVRGYACGGHTDKVEDLIAHGASINEAVWGYARGGWVNRVENLIARGAGLNEAAQAYARGGYVDKVENLIARGANLNEAVWGYAYGGYADKVEDLITRGAKLNYAAWGYARGGYADKVENLIGRGADLRGVIWGYSRGGYADKVENLIARGASLDNAVQGYARGGYVDKVENLIARGASLDEAVRSYAFGGYVGRVENLIARGANAASAIWGYASRGYADRVEDLINRGVNLSIAAKSYEKAGYFKNQETALKILTLTKNIRIRKELAEFAEKANSSLHHLLRKSFKIEQLIKENDMDFTQASLMMRPWMMLELHTWFLQGIKFVKNNQLPLDIFIYISTFVAGLPLSETRRLFEKHLAVMPRKLFDISIKSAEEQFIKDKKKLNDRFYKKSLSWRFKLFGHRRMTQEEYLTKKDKITAEYLEKQNAAKERYKKRLTF